MPSILITGANRGLGLEFAKQYAADGYRVFATARAPKEAGELLGLAKAHPQLSIHTLAVDQPGSIAELARELAGHPIDILLNNAGGAPSSKAWGRSTSRECSRPSASTASRRCSLPKRFWRTSRRASAS